MSANAGKQQLSALTKFGRALGLAFQVIDDILDVTQTTEKLGKSAGKDVAAQKATYPAVIGLEKSRLEARRLTRIAHNALSTFGDDGERLRQLANYLLERECPILAVRARLGVTYDRGDAGNVRIVKTHTGRRLKLKNNPATAAGAAAELFDGEVNHSIVNLEDQGQADLAKIRIHRFDPFTESVRIEAAHITNQYEVCVAGE